jgi:hypothetical protein
VTRSNPGECFYSLLDNIPDGDDDSIPDLLSCSTHTPEPNASPEATSTTCGSIHGSSGTTETDNQSTQVYSPDGSLSMDAHKEAEGEVDGPPHPDMAAAAALITAAVSSASASFINPSFFSGTAKEDARDWLTYLENWIRYKNLKAESQQRLFPLKFLAQAASWFESLDDNQKDTFEHLQTAFCTRYLPNDLSRWQTLSDMWTRKQTKSETVDEYSPALMNMARIANVEDRDVRHNKRATSGHSTTCAAAKPRGARGSDSGRKSGRTVDENGRTRLHP